MKKAIIIAISLGVALTIGAITYDAITSHLEQTTYGSFKYKCDVCKIGIYRIDFNKEEEKYYRICSICGKEEIKYETSN